MGVLAAHLELDVEIFARPAAGEKVAPGPGLLRAAHVRGADRTSASTA